MRRFLAAACGVILAIAATPGAQEKPEPVTAERLVAGHRDQSQWLMAGGDYTAQRHSPLTQVTPQNVSRLAHQWTFQTGTLGALEASARPADFAAKVQQVRTTWNRSVPIPSAEAKVLADRWQATLTQVIQQHADAFAGSDFDPAVALQRMEKLVAKIEALLADVKDDAPGLSATEALAAKLRSALASKIWTAFPSST